MKFFEIELDYDRDIGTLKTKEKILEILQLIDPKTENIKFSDGFWRFRDDLICTSISGKIYWTDNIDSKLSEYNTSTPYDFFKTENGEVWLTGSDISDLLKGNNLPQLILSPISDNQGYDFANKLLELYNKSAIEYAGMPKGIPKSIFIFDSMIELAGDAQNYLRGIQTKWNEKIENKPELYIITGQRFVKKE